MSPRPICLSGEVAFYARRVIRELGIKEPPIMPEPILEYFGLECRQIDFSEEHGLQLITGMAMETPALLYREDGQNLIIVKGTDIIERRRLSIFHECGHFDIPWHQCVSYLCPCGELDMNSIRKMEKEAFGYASHIMFPDKPFYDEIRGLPFCLNSIEIFSQRYLGSFEATAIRYLESAPGLCAIIYLKRNFGIDSSEFPYVVRYSVKSERFHRFWGKREKIKYHDLLECGFNECRRCEGEIPASVFGSQRKHAYAVEVKKYGSDQICVFLTMPDNQLVLI